MWTEFLFFFQLPGTKFDIEILTVCEDTAVFRGYIILNKKSIADSSEKIRRPSRYFLDRSAVAAKVREDR